MPHKDTLRHSWEANAQNWTKAVRHNHIPSRVAVTDQAIIDAVKSCAPDRLLDMGCGEGWLTRRVASEMKCTTYGVDASPALIQKAQEAHEGGHYDVMDYKAVIGGALGDRAPFDLIAFNFALLDKAVSPLLSAVKSCLTPKGTILIQTVHPTSLPADTAEGWQTEDFTAFEGTHWTPMPWYFRKLGTWKKDIAAAGLVLRNVTEPKRNEENKTPLSLLFICSPQKN